MSNEKPVWARLKDMLCPKCRNYIDLKEGVYTCTKALCDFSIGEARFNELVEELYHPKQREYA